MKRSVMCLLLTVLTILIVSVSATAAGELSNITDAAGLLTDREWSELEMLSEQVSEQFQVGVYIVTCDDYCEIHTDGAYEATYTIYHDYSMGMGDDRDGIMLLLSMKERDWAFFCYGENCEYAFNEYGQEQLEEVFLDNFKEDDWYGGFQDFIRECAIYLEKAQNGQPVRESAVFPTLILCIIFMIVPTLVVGILYHRMKSVQQEVTANAYVTGQLNLTDQSDQFTHRTTVRRKIETSSSGSRSHSGGGGSGRSGKF